MNYDEVLELPLKVFSLYNTSINRLRAEEDIRAIRVVAASNGGDYLKELSNSLYEDMGETVQLEGESYVQPEEGALEKLKGLSSLR